MCLLFLFVLPLLFLFLDFFSFGCLAFGLNIIIGSFSNTFSLFGDGRPVRPDAAAVVR